MKVASKKRTSQYVNVKKCRGCGKAFWTKDSWNRETVRCPFCSKDH